MGWHIQEMLVLLAEALHKVGLTAMVLFSKYY